MTFSEFLDTAGREIIDRLRTYETITLPLDVRQELETIAYRLRSAAHYMKRKESENVKT